MLYAEGLFISTSPPAPDSLPQPASLYESYGSLFLLGIEEGEEGGEEKVEEPLGRKVPKLDIGSCVIPG